MKTGERLSITIGIAAYNAEKNIRPMLNALRRQIEKTARIESIIVYSDASADHTVSESRLVDDPRVLVIDAPERKGFANALLSLMRLSKTEWTVLLNDDIQIADDSFIEKLAAAAASVPNAGLLSGNPQPLRPKNFIERAAVSAFRAYEQIRYKVQDGHNQFTCDGKVLALSKRLFQTMTIPSKYADMGNVDAFLYFSCLESGLTYRHVKEAIVYGRYPSTVRDYVRWTVRNNSDKFVLRQRFGGIVDREYQKPLPWSLYFQGLEFLRNPIGALFIFTVGQYAAYKARSDNAGVTATWDVVTTSKNL